MPRKVRSEVRISGRIRTSDYFLADGGAYLGKAVVDYNMEGANNVVVYDASGEELSVLKSQVEARQLLYDNYTMDHGTSANS